MDNIWIHKGKGNQYKVISENARMKDMTMPDRWVDCVIYSPMYDNQYEMFSREKYDFYDKFEKQEKTTVGQVIVRFYRENGEWYADIPNHTKEENQMVMGSDLALDFLAKDRNEIILTLSDEVGDGLNMLHFHRLDHDDDGAYYQVCGSYDLIEPIWICNVTHDVFGEHPEDIYLRSFERK